MKVLIFLNTSWWIYNFKKNLVLSYLSAGYEVHAMAPYDEYSEKLRELGCKYHDIKLEGKSRNPFKELALLRRTSQMLKQISPDIVLNFTIKPNVYGTLAAHKLGIACINNFAGLGTLPDQGISGKLLFRNLLKISQKKAGWIYVANKEDHNYLVRKNIIPSAKSRAIPGTGVDLKEFPLVPLVKSDKTIILLLARMIYPKGVEDLVKAADILAKTNDANFEVILLGEKGVDNPHAIPEAKLIDFDSRKYISYHEKTDHVLPFLHKAHIIVLPSYYREGLPKSLLEALASGRPVITTQIPGCKETVREGINGFYCKAQSPESLAGAMRSFIQLPFEKKVRFGQESRRLAEEKFDEQIIIREYLQKTNEILNGDSE